MKTLLVLSFAVVSAASQAVTIPLDLASWNFNGSNLTKSSGSSIASVVGVGLTGTTAINTTFAQGNSAPLTDRGVNFTNFPTQGTLSNSAGVRVNVSTVGLFKTSYDRIRVNLDWRASNTGSNKGQFAYTTDGGTTWTNLSTISQAAGATYISAKATSYTVDGNAFVISDPLAFNNANFGVRLLSVFNTASAYSPANAGSTYGTGGTWRFDNLSVQAVPEPASMAVLALGLVALRRRSVKK